jgi:hypothetical protein
MRQKVPGAEQRVNPGIAPEVNRYVIRPILL